MAVLNSNIQDVKDESWKLFKFYLETDKEIGKILLEKEGKDFLDKVYKNNKIGTYQWKYESNGTHNLLQSHYFRHFFLTIKGFAKKRGLNKNSTELIRFFEEKFDILEKEVLLSDSFDYLLLIPTFGAKFPVGDKEFILDSNHIIKDITDIEKPHNIPSFKETPKSWKQYWSDKPKALMEVKFSLKKRTSNDKPYEEGITPSYPFSIFSHKDIFNEKLKSIHDFFICYGRHYDPEFFTFGDVYFAILPPFSQRYDHMNCYTYYAFPPPQRELYLDFPDKSQYHIDWKNVWNNNYDNFYKTFYSYDITLRDVESFRYAMDILVSIRNIPYSNVSNFLLISTFEGLLYHKNLYKKLNSQLSKYSLAKIISKNNNRIPCTKAFLEICEDQKEYWQWIFQRKYPLKTPLNTFGTKQDLENFIDSCFDYRNKIAHPEITKPIQIKPRHLIPPLSKDPEEFILEKLISQVFPSFLIFLIMIWLKKGFKIRTDWDSYIDSLFP
ncbi:hypothetical protein ES705_05745 [subsurface metagenome]